MLLNYTQEEMKDLPIYAPLSKKQMTYLNDKENDIICFGGAASSGKSFLSALDILVNGWADKNYRATIVRRQKEQFKQAGGLYDECCTMYAQFGVKPRGQSMDFKFPKGAFTKMMGSDAVKDKYNFQGNQSTTFLVDEAQQLNEENVVYLLSRLRSKSKQKHQLKLTCNPEYDSFLRKWLDMGGYLDKEGIPLPEMDGVTTYYVELAGETVFKPSLKAFQECYPDLKLGEDYEPLKFVFYSANVHDNPFIVKHHKSYVAKLKNLPLIEKQKLYFGSWYARLESSGLFKRNWVTIKSFADIPPQMRLARCWDKAATLPSSINPDPDWTVGIKGGLDEDGNLWIIDVKRFRERSAIVQLTIEETGLADGKNVAVGIPQDVGGAGVDAMETSRALLFKRGLNVIVSKASKGKAVRFEPVAIATQSGQVFVIEADWNEAFFSELETLDFSSRKRYMHDDQADALSDLLQVLRKKLLVPTIRMGTNSRSLTRRTLLR